MIRNCKTWLAWYRILYFCVGKLLVDSSIFRRYITRGPLVLYRSPECWGYVKISGYWGKQVETDNSLRPKILCQQKSLITMIICCKLKKESLQPLTLYTSFHDLINVYSCRSGTGNPRGKILMSTETSCHFGHLLQVSKNLFEVWFYTMFFMILYMYIAPRQGLTTP